MPRDAALSQVRHRDHAAPPGSASTANSRSVCGEVLVEQERRTSEASSAAPRHHDLPELARDGDAHGAGVVDAPEEAVVAAEDRPGKERVPLGLRLLEDQVLELSPQALERSSG